jgi:hypothetical protein
MSQVESWRERETPITPKMMDEARLLIEQIKTYLSLHNAELVICMSHWDCGREGKHGKDKKTLLDHLRAMGRYVQRKIGSNHKVALLFVMVESNHTVGAEEILFED